MRKVWTSPESMAVNGCGVELYLNLYLRIVPQRQYYLASARERWKVLLSRISYSVWGGKPHVMQREWYCLRDMLGHSRVCIPCLRCCVSDILERCVETYRIRLIIERALIFFLYYNAYCSCWHTRKLKMNASTTYLWELSQLCILWNGAKITQLCKNWTSDGCKAGVRYESMKTYRWWNCWSNATAL